MKVGEKLEQWAGKFIRWPWYAHLAVFAAIALVVTCAVQGWANRNFDKNTDLLLALLREEQRLDDEKLAAISANDPRWLYEVEQRRKDYARRRADFRAAR